MLLWFRGSLKTDNVAFAALLCVQHSVFQTHRLYKDGRHDSSPKVKPNHLHRPLVAGCSIGHKPGLLHVSGWGMDQTKRIKVHVKWIFLKDWCMFKCSFSYEFGFNYSFDAIKTEWNVFTGSKDWLAIGRARVSAELRYRGSTPWSLLCRLWLRMMSKEQDGGMCIQDIVCRPSLFTVHVQTSEFPSPPHTLEIAQWTQHNVRRSTSAEICSVFGTAGEFKSEGKSQTAVRAKCDVTRTVQICNIIVTQIYMRI